ncbi:ATP-dependent DNA helicase RecG [Bacillus alkalicellulosilyticus]|uniref:ATP-dependent DNA helicase RecG n=1 Tax=Alkalihalobacterium alkalicellulosilyticum TaxID=1912214 RepID=UPI0009989471|nr:ATP-dependent DNA helicase RecG [Bacillus alkalicellulosilyticus]
MSYYDDVSVIRGVGEETAQQLAVLGIRTVADLIEYFPYRYEDYQLRDIHDIKHDERVTLAGVIQSEPVTRFFGKKKSKTTIRILVGNILITAAIFNRSYVKNQMKLGETITLTGKWDQHRLTVTVSEYKLGLQNSNELSPVYSVAGKLTVKQLRKLIYEAIKQHGDAIPEWLPVDVLDKYKLMPRRDAIITLHYPKESVHVKQARRRMVYEEFLLFQLKMQAFRKMSREQASGISYDIDMNKVDAFIDSLPFELTKAQKRVVSEILQDISSPLRMNRLLQGDVGSGKTAVAAVCMYAVISSGAQAALMVPTEILAEQHLDSLTELLEPFGVSVTLLTSSVKGKKRRERLEKLATGEIQMIVGTHALIQEEVIFHKLGLVITDEQHRFGVEQRRVLRDKGEHPDVLFMTATPIPRTLAISVFGDMDVSVIDELPAGRKQIETYWAKHNQLDRVLNFIQKELQKGRQAYVICPLIEESEKLDVQNAIDVHAILQSHYQNYKVGLMHGRLSSTEKDEVMEDFSTNTTQILVSTTVVEVGVNVPNASIMVIYDAERFGLSQLHQLRGRVGRGEFQSYCILLADPKSEVGKERMKIMTETNDGFVLSEKDLELRGPGDFFGQKQSGLPHFKLGDIVHDFRTLEVARQDASELVRTKAFWEDGSWALIRNYLKENGVFDGEKLD